jgi:hypothetical protein
MKEVPALSHSHNLDFEHLAEKKREVLQTIRDFGFVVLLNVFSGAEVNDFRSRCIEIRKIKNKGQVIIGNAFGQFESLGELLINSRIVRIFQSCLITSHLGSGDILICSSVH